MDLGGREIDFEKVAESQSVKGEKVASAVDLESALKRGIAATRDGKPYLIEVATARIGGGAESTWYEKFNLAEKRKRRASRMVDASAIAGGHIGIKFVKPPFVPFF